MILNALSKVLNKLAVNFQLIPEETTILISKNGVLFNINDYEVTNKDELLKGLATNQSYNQTNIDFLTKLEDQDIIILKSI